MSKLGRFTTIAAEASIWLAGAAMVAGAAGAHWSMPQLPAVDLGGLIAESSPRASGSPGGSPDASHSPKAATPAPSPSPGASPATVLAKYVAYTHAPGFQFDATYTQTLTAHNTNGTTKVTANGKGTGVGQDCAEGWASSNSHSYDLVLVGSTTYERSDNGAWTKSSRESNATCEMVGLLSYGGLVDKGIQSKNGAKLHRLEVADAVQFGSYLEKFESKATGQTATQATLVVWVKDDGSPVALQLSSSYIDAVGGVATSVTDTRDYAVSKLTGVTVTAPKV